MRPRSVILRSILSQIRTIYELIVKIGLSFLEDPLYNEHELS